MNVFDELHAKRAEWHRRAKEAHLKAADAYRRLVYLAETGDSGQISKVARFVASTFNGQAYPFDLFYLRSLDVELSDDMLVCLDALRWAKADLYRLLPDGEARVKAIIKLWGIVPNPRPQ